MGNTYVCPKCQGTMEEGYIPDAGYGRYSLARWVRGQPEVSLWSGGLRGLSPLDPADFTVMTYRCVKCSYLESYARPGDDSES